KKLTGIIRASTQFLALPRGVVEDFRPAGEVHALVAPLDALAPAGRDDVGVARRAAKCRRGDERGTRSGAGRSRRADAAFPDRDAYDVRRLDLRELDVRAVRKHLVPLERRAEPLEARAIGQRAERHAL